MATRGKNHSFPIDTHALTDLSRRNFSETPFFSEAQVFDQREEGNPCQLNFSEHQLSQPQ